MASPSPASGSPLLGAKAAGVVGALLGALAYSRWDLYGLSVPCDTARSPFCEFRRAGCIVQDALDIREKDGQRYLAVLRDVRAGELLFWVPETAILRASIDPMAQANSSDDDQPTEREVLAASLLAEKRLGNASAFAAQAAMLPARPLSFLTYPPELQAVLRKRFTVFSAKDVPQMISMVRKNVSSEISPPPSDEEVKWALAVVDSRASAAFAAKYALAMVPIYDLANRGPDDAALASCQVTAGGWAGYWQPGVECRSPELRAGSEVLVSYGKSPHLFYLSQYGFAPQQRQWLRRLIPDSFSNVPEEYNCTDSTVWFSQNVTEDTIWSALRCLRLTQVRGLQNGPGVQEYASEHGWFNVPFSALPRAKEAIGAIPGDRVYYLSVVESNVLKKFRETIDKSWEDLRDTDGLKPLLAALEAAKSAWDPELQRLAAQVQEEMEIDIAAVDRFFEVLDKMQEHFAWTDEFKGQTVS